MNTSNHVVAGRDLFQVGTLRDWRALPWLGHDMDTAERRLHDAKLGAAIENAAGKLPDGWNVCITIEGGGYGVSLFDPGGNDIEMDGSDSLADDVVNAVAEAIAIASTEDMSPS